MAVVTLISDRRGDDFFLGRLKGQLLSACNNLNIVDLAHNLTQHSVSNAAFILKNSFKNFPNNTVHLIGVDGECAENKKHLIAKVDNQFFIAADNGLFSLAFEPQEIQEIIKIDTCEHKIPKMPALFRFGKIACEIINGKNIIDFGKRASGLKRLMGFNPTFGKDYILGHVVYIDSYHNAVTDISYDLFIQISKGRKFEIIPAIPKYKITKIHHSYHDVKPSELVAIFNSLGLLEIAMYKGNVSKLLNYNFDTQIRINFFD